MASYLESQEDISFPNEQGKVGEVVDLLSLDSTDSMTGSKTQSDQKFKVLPSQRFEDSQFSEQSRGSSWFQIQPLLGVFALMIAVGALLGALVVLLVSNGQRVSSWPIQPTVYLAIASAVGVSALRLAKGRATPISFWYMAYQGSTIQSLEYHWEAGQSLIGALKYFKVARWISFSTLLYLFMIIDGAMLQRASTVVPTTMSTNVSLSVQLAPEIPTGFSGIFINSTQLVSSAVTTATEGYLHQTPMLLEAKGCDDGASCSAKILGPGVSVQDCKNRTWPISKQMLFTPNATWGPYHGVYGRFMMNPAFNILVESAWASNSSKRESGFLSTGRVDWGLQGGHYIESNCTLVPAVLEYDVQFSGGQVFLQSPADGKVIALANNTQRPAIYDPKPIPCTVGSFFDFLEIVASANASAVFTVPAIPGDYWSLYPATLDLEAAKYLEFTNEALALKFRDPGPGIIGIMNEMLFRGGIVAGAWSNTTRMIDEGLSPDQKIHASSELKVNVFRSDLRWFAGAAVLDLLAILAILPLFWGFWRLPRNATQSPFELALAFDAPLVNSVHSTAGAQGVVSEKGDLSVAFGLVRDHSASSGRLGIGKSTQVTKPQHNTRFTN